MIDTNQTHDEPAAVRVHMLAVVLGPVVVTWTVLMLWVPMELVSGAIALGTVVVPVLAVVWVTSEPMAWKWARDRGVEFDRSLAPQLHRHLLRTRLGRTLGVTLGLAIGTMLMAHYNAGPRAFRWYITVWNAEIGGLWLSGLGYATASVWAEFTKPRWLTGDGAGMAVLAPRRLRDFADAALLRWVVPVVMAVPAAVVLWTLAPTPSQPVSNRLKEGVLVGSGLVAVGALVAAILICRRSERSADETAVAYEELTRSASVNALLGVAIAMFAQVTGELLDSRVVTEWVSGWIVVPLVLAFGVAPVATWYASGTSLVFRSRRMDALRLQSMRAAT